MKTDTEPEGNEFEDSGGEKKVLRYDNWKGLVCRDEKKQPNVGDSNLAHMPRKRADRVNASRDTTEEGGQPGRGM